jgi:hypothetical protein
VHDQATIYDYFFKNNVFFDPSQKSRLIDIMNKYGIASKIRVHYGPGVTPRPGQTVSAADKNRDIYIRKTCSNLLDPCR